MESMVMMVSDCMERERRPLGLQAVFKEEMSSSRQGSGRG